MNYSYGLIYYCCGPYTTKFFTRKRPRPRPRKRRCLLKGCEQPFHPPQASQRYCSATCRKAARRWSRWKAQQRYRATKSGKAKRTDQSRRYRERIKTRKSPFAAHELGHANRSARLERPFSFIEGNFLAGPTFASWEDLNQQARQWCGRVNSTYRKHLRAVPRELFAVERLQLKPLPAWIPEVYRRHQRLVDIEGYVALNSNRYSVPLEWIGRRVEVRETRDKIEIQLDARRLVTHRRIAEAEHQRVMRAEHRPPRGQRTLRPDPQHQRAVATRSARMRSASWARALVWKNMFSASWRRIVKRREHGNGSPSRSRARGPTPPPWHLCHCDRKRSRSGCDSPADWRTDAPPLRTIRSLAYFLPVIEEVLELRISPDYFQYLRQKFHRISQNR